MSINNIDTYKIKIKETNYITFLSTLLYNVLYTNLYKKAKEI